MAKPGNTNAQRDYSKRDHYVHIRTTGENKGAWIRASRANGQKLTQWVEETLNARVNNES